MRACQRRRLLSSIVADTQPSHAPPWPRRNFDQSLRARGHSHPRRARWYVPSLALNYTGGPRRHPAGSMRPNLPRRTCFQMDDSPSRSRSTIAHVPLARAQLPHMYLFVPFHPVPLAGFVSNWTTLSLARTQLPHKYLSLGINYPTCTSLRRFTPSPPCTPAMRPATCHAGLTSPPCRGCAVC